MKKSLKISLGGIAFNIEDDAYKILDEYLKSLKIHLGKSTETDEVVKDIEERAADLFTEMLSGNEIVTIDMVNKVIAVLGKPEQITDKEADQNSEEKTTGSDHIESKRLYRDGDNAIIGGVCSGLGSYFNIDPLVIRVIFAALILAKGLGFFVYLILWIAVPKAQTVRQRMEMRGEPINLSNLEKNIKNEFEEVQKNMKKHNVSSLFERAFSAMGQIFMALGSIVVVIAKIFAIIFAILFISIGLIGLLASVSSLFLGNFITSLFPAFSGLTVNELLSTTIDLGSMLWVTLPVFTIVAIPLIGLIYLGLRMVLPFRARDSVFFVIAASVWIMAVTVLAFVVFLQARSFTIRESIVEKIELTDPLIKSKSLMVLVDKELDQNSYLPERIVSIDDYTVAYTDGLPKIIGKPKFFIGKSNGDNYELRIIKKSRGTTKQIALRSAEDIKLSIQFSDSSVVFDPFFSLSKDAKWRAQDMEVTINIPEGKSVYIDNSVEKYLSADQEYFIGWPDELIGKTWTMKGDKLLEQK